MTNVSTNPIPTPAISAEARAYLAQALNLDLIGPPANHELAEERIPGWVRPSTGISPDSSCPRMRRRSRASMRTRRMN